MWPVFIVLGDRSPRKAMREGAGKELNVFQKHNINIHIWHVSSITYIIKAIVNIPIYWDGAFN